MSSGELLVIFVVALLVFGPNKLPMLAAHLGRLTAWVIRLRQQLQKEWQNEINRQQLQDNLKKAEVADKSYEKPASKENSLNSQS